MTEAVTAPFAVVERTDLVPRCPHCDEGLPEVYARARGVPLGQGRTLMYFCPHCLKVLGFAQGRMI
jgi:hypothetical protein